MTPIVPGPAISRIWRYPDLAVRIRWSDHIDDQEQARLIARGIADRHTPDSAVRRLVEDGEFAVAGTVRDEVIQLGLVDHQTAERLSELIEAERGTAAEQATVRARLLQDRGERIGMSEIDLTAVAADARDRRADVQTYLDEIDLRLEQAERDRTMAVERDLDALLGEDESAAAQIWAGQVRALLTAREFSAAGQLLAEGPGAAPLLPVEEPTASWPWNAYGLDEVLDWFAGAPGPPALREYVRDEAGETLLRAMRQLAEAGDAGHLAMAAALQELVGAEGITPYLESLPNGGHESMLLIPDEFRLPPMNFVGRGGGLRMTIGGEGPDRDAVWLATRIRQARRPGSVVLDLGGLLSLLQAEKPRSGRPRSASSRRMGLIRMVCQQLPVLKVITPGAFAGMPRVDLRRQVWWLLHAFGVSPDGVAVDTLLYESGSHPGILAQTLHFLVEDARRERFRPARARGIL